MSFGTFLKHQSCRIFNTQAFEFGKKTRLLASLAVVYTVLRKGREKVVIIFGRREVSGELVPVEAVLLNRYLRFVKGRVGNVGIGFDAGIVWQIRLGLISFIPFCLFPASPRCL